MNQTLKALSALLSYPTAELQQAAPEIRAIVLADGGLDKAVKARLVKLVEEIENSDLFDAQERYVMQFDRTRALSLHLFEHVHGESRDRGQAMVDLMDMYQRDGFFIQARELPDYLPLFLEYLSLVSGEEARELLAQTLHITAAIGERLEKRASLYAGIFKALERLSHAKPEKHLFDELMKQGEDDPTDLEALDKIWEDEAVTFGANAGENACGPDRLRTQMRATSRRPADPTLQANN
jgi:nitrate reductase delta subunit